MNKVVAVLSIVAIVLSSLALMKSNHSEHVEVEKEIVVEEEFELADVMAKFQYHYNKLWFAAQAENWELAAFYAHELEESFESLEEANVIEEGQNLSQLLKQMALPAFEELEVSIKKKDLSEFTDNYNALINGCNSCHAATQHGFIQIKVPETKVIDNQVY